MTEKKKIKERLQKAVTLGSQLEDLTRNDGFKESYEPWLRKSVEILKDDLPTKYGQLSDREFGIMAGRIIGLTDALEYIEIQIKRGKEAQKKLGELNG